MAGHLYMLTLITICISCITSAANHGCCNLETVHDSLEAPVSKVTVLTNAINGMREAQEIIRRDQEHVKLNQDDLKKHTLKRLQALDEKTEWCLSSVQKGAHPFDERMAKIEQLLADNLTPPKDCQDVRNRGETTSSIHTISPDGITKMKVYCEQEVDGGGWTVFQLRHEGNVDFYRNWDDYKTGFGNLTGEFWLGNDNLHLLTKEHDQKLKIELRSPDGEITYADYSSFWIDNENLKYKLHVSGFSGADPPGDSFASRHNQRDFTTKDRDHDRDSGNCAQDRHGAWWYDTCFDSNLNGRYGGKVYAQDLIWKTWKGWGVFLTGSKMMVKKLSGNSA